MTNQERKQLIDTNYADNNNGDITAAKAREVLHQLSDDLEVADGNASAALNRLNDVGLQNNNGVIETALDIKRTTAQSIPNDPVAIAADNRLITVANAFEIEKSLKEYSDQTFGLKIDVAKKADKTYVDTELAKKMDNAPMEHFKLVGKNPAVEMEIEPGGTAAQMQVLYNGHAVASMQYDTVTKSFSFTLNDPNTGASKAIFQIKADGRAYITGNKIPTIAEVPILDASGALAFSSWWIGSVSHDSLIVFPNGARLSNNSTTNNMTIETKSGGKLVHKDGTTEHQILTNADLPPMPTADGEYKLVVANGAATWVTI